MAELEIGAGHLIVRLTALEKTGGLHGDIEVPLDRVRAVRTVEDPWQEVRGIRAPGTGWPGVIALGTRRGSGFTDFSAVYHHAPAVVVEIDGGEYDRLVVSSQHAEDDAAMIRAAAGMPGA